MAKKPVYQLFDEMRRGGISRRDFLRRSAIAGATTPLIANYLDAGHVAAAPARRFSLTQAMAQGSMLEPPAADADTSEQLVFRGWNFLPEIVIDNTKRFNEAFNENADYQTVTGDYIGIMENFHVAGQPLDLAYANPATLYRWSIPGWVQNYERWWNLEAAKAELYPGVRDSMTINGELYGLPYFVSIRGTMMATPSFWKKLVSRPTSIRRRGPNSTISVAR